MPSEPAIATKRPPRDRRRGFTLVEMIVVVAIIGLLIGILVPAVMLARQGIAQGATRQFMASIAIGLGTYEQDFGALPPSDADAVSGNTFGLTGMSGWSGAALMTQALAGASAADGRKGFGFRVGGATSGPASGPYIEPGEFDLKEDAGRFYLTDQWDRPILYYRARAGQNSLWPSGRFVRSDNGALDGDDPALDSHPSADPTALRAAGYVLYSLGRDGANGDAEQRGNDVIVLEP